MNICRQHYLLERGQYWNRRSYYYYYKNGKKVKLPLDSFRIDIYDHPFIACRRFPRGKDGKVAYFLSKKIHPNKKYEEVGSFIAEDVTDDEVIQHISLYKLHRYNFDVIERVIASIKNYLS